MKRIKHLIIPFLTLCLFSVLWSCSEMDEYKKFTEGGEISYTGKMDSLKILPGKNRVLLQGLIIADPKVSEYRVFWNSGKDSISVPIDRSQGVDTISKIIEGLEENIYNFEVRTYDDPGNSSIPVYSTGEVFGERYQNSLNNRPVISNELVGSNLTVNYAGMDRTSGVIGTEIDYTTTAGEMNTAFVPIDSSSAIINDFSSGSEYRYRTLFVPEPTSIDTFYANYKAFTPQMQISSPPYFKNASYPFEIGDNSGGRWNTPANWIHNEAALSHEGYGALDGDLFDIESGWGQPDIINGKVYQTFVLEPGTYVYNINIKEMNYQGADSNKDKGYFTVAMGASLPDVDKVESSDATLAYERINKANGLSRTLTFTINEVTQVSIGVETTNDQGAGRYLKINSFDLGKLAEAPYLKNASSPYEIGDNSGGRWNTPANWTHNEAALSHNGYGALDGNLFDIESGWGEADIINGKVYQTIYLEPGTYTYSIDIKESNYEGGDTEKDNGYFVVAKGATLPDVADVETSEEVLVYEQVHKSNLAPSMEFTINEITQVSIGVETTNDQEQGRYLKINSFNLNKN